LFRSPTIVLLASLAAAVVLTACVVPPPSKPIAKYVPPTDGQTAKLVMRGTLPAGDNYGVYVYSDSEKCTGLRSVGTGTNTRNPASTLLAANQIATVEFFLVKPTVRSYCSIRYSFTPIAGRTYLLSGAAADKGCSARMLDMSDPENIKPEPTALRRNPAGTACLPLSQSRAATLAGNGAAQKSGDAVLRQGASADDLQGLIGP